MSADLGTRCSSNSNHNQSVTASVSGIVDGSGSIGAAITQVRVLSSTKDLSP